jgi:hypothetical protein
MEDQDYALKKEFVGQLLLSNKDFFTGSTLEFKIFRYTSFIAVYTFTIQLLLLLIQYFNGDGFLDYIQTVSFFFGSLGLFFLLILYFKVNKIIGLSTSSKREYLKSYSCETCNFHSFSNGNSTFHAISNPDHLVKEHIILLRSKFQNLSNSPWAVFKKRSIKMKETQKGGVEDYGEIITDSEQRVFIRKEPVNIKPPVYFILIFTGLFIFDYVLFGANHTILWLWFITTVVTLSLSYIIIRLMVGEELVEEDDIFVYMMIMRLAKQSPDKAPEVDYKLYTCGIEYWNNIKKGKLGEPIKTPKGLLYLLDNMVWNKFGELIEVNFDNSSGS